MNPTHFIMIYSVTAKNIGTGELIQDYCVAALREMEYLEPFAKDVGDDAVAIFKIKAR